MGFELWLYTLHTQRSRNTPVLIPFLVLSVCAKDPCNQLVPHQNGPFSSFGCSLCSRMLKGTDKTSVIMAGDIFSFSKGKIIYVVSVPVPRLVILIFVSSREYSSWMSASWL